MPFGPTTLDTQSLGGSETAALMLGKELVKRGHNVKMFCNLPPRERPDHWPGGKASDGVVYVPLEHYQGVAATAQSDLTIIVRDPRLAPGLDPEEGAVDTRHRDEARDAARVRSDGMVRRSGLDRQRMARPTGS